MNDRIDPNAFILISIGFYVARISHWAYWTHARLGTTNDLLREMLAASKPKDPESASPEK